jgi:hypothetical protein
LYLNGRRLNRWSGEVGWTNYVFAVPAGTNTLEWRYSKDLLNTSAGMDAAFIDSLDLPLLVPLNESSPAHLDLTRLSTGGYQLSVQGQTGQVYLIQSASTLNAWTTIGTNTARHGQIRWTDSASGAQGMRFYRAIVP